MSEEDWWSRWLRKRRPFFGSWFTEDADEVFRKMEETMAEELKELTRKAPNNLVRERTLSDGRKVKQWGPFVYGYSVTIGPDGKPRIKEFGNVKTETRMGRPRIEVKQQREPLLDILETDDHIQVIAELPGVEKQDIKLYVTEDTLTISVNTPNRKYHKETQLPVKVETKQAKSSYKNGVLEVLIPIRKKEKAKGELINIE